MTVSKIDLESYVDRLRSAPRLKMLAAEFSQLADGSKGKPVEPVHLDPALLGYDREALEFNRVLEEASGTFDAHYVASVPYSREEECRIGAAWARYGTDFARRKGRPMNLYMLGAADGAESRALTAFSNGLVRTLTCSPNRENESEFFERGAPDGAYFFLGPYFEVTPQSLQDKGMPQFSDRFDIVVEDTTFQMYAPERYEQISLARKNLRDGGIFITVEKLRHEDRDEYLQREEMKDRLHKARYFTPEQIRDKSNKVLGHMETLQATLDELVTALSQHFAEGVLIYNCANFFTLAASDDPQELRAFVSELLAPGVPSQFSHHPTPTALFGTSDNYQFRQPSP